MNETNKRKSIIMVPCVDCNALNRVEIEFSVTHAKTIEKEEERTKLESEANNDRGKPSTKTEGERVRPNDSQGKPVEGSTSDSTSDPTRKPSNRKTKKGEE